MKLKLKKRAVMLAAVGLMSIILTACGTKYEPGKVINNGYYNKAVGFSVVNNQSNWMVTDGGISDTRAAMGAILIKDNNVRCVDDEKTREKIHTTLSSYSE